MWSPFACCRIGSRFAVALINVAIVAVTLLMSGPVKAQWGDLCPPGSSPVSAGGGMMCMCPDGSYASLGVPCAQAGPRCPYNTQECGSVCCNPGFQCTQYGCIPHGSVECGGWYCNPGQKCSWMHGRCVPLDRVDCGTYNCAQGTYCAKKHNACLSEGDVDCDGYACQQGFKCSKAGCIPADAVACSSKTYCSAGNKCPKSDKVKGCFPKENTDCGDYSCSPGKKCSSAGCIPQDAVDCKNKAWCAAGKKCSRDGKHCFDTAAADCGSYSCSMGTKCASGNQCIASDAVDCKDGRSCANGMRCASGRQCLLAGYSDCGDGTACAPSQKCSRGGGCIASSQVDCGKGVGCAADNKCLPDSSGCMPKNAVACSGGHRYCPQGTECVAADQCMSPAQIKEARQAAEEERRRIAIEEANKSQTAAAATVAQPGSKGAQQITQPSAVGQAVLVYKNPLGPGASDRVTQSWGKPWSADASKLHTGADIGAPRGAPVLSTGAGKVVKLGWLGCKDDHTNTRPLSTCSGRDQNWGNYVIVQRSDGSAVGYLHIDPTPGLKLGSEVTDGTVMGGVYSDHLHYNECKSANGCQRGGVAPEVFKEGNYLSPNLQ